MPNITFRLPDGREKIVAGENGETLMEAAKAANIDEIIAECGGALNCATCHVYVDDAWIEKLPVADEAEQDLLEVVSDLRPGSRLSCQISLTDALDGIVIDVPEAQF